MKNPRRETWAFFILGHGVSRNQTGDLLTTSSTPLRPSGGLAADPATLGKPPVDGDHQPDGRAEELEVAARLGQHALPVAPGDAEEAVETAAELAATEAR